MTHKMKLKEKPFKLIKNGSKTVELRLYDEKRQLLKEKDLIEFTNISTLEKVLVEVQELLVYSDFQELYKHFDKTSMGYKENDNASYKDMEEYYSSEEQKKYGVVAIRIKLVS